MFVNVHDSTMVIDIETNIGKDEFEFWFCHFLIHISIIVNSRLCQVICDRCIHHLGLCICPIAGTDKYFQHLRHFMLE